MKKLFTLLLVLITCSVSAIDMGPYDTGAARKSDLGTMAAEAATDYVATDTFTGHTGATGASVHGLGTISTKAATDYVATSALALRLDTTNASISNNLDVAGNVGAATVNGIAPLTTAEKTQALVGSSTVDFSARTLQQFPGNYLTELVLICFDVKTQVATFTFGDYSGAEIELVSAGVQSGIGTAAMKHTARVSRATGALSVSVASETWGEVDIVDRITFEASGNTTLGLFIVSDTNGMVLESSLHVKGSISSVEVVR